MKCKCGECKARAVIGLSLFHGYLEHLRDVQTAKQMWPANKNVFERLSLLTILFAFINFNTVTIEDGEKVISYINNVKQLAHLLHSMEVGWSVSASC